MTKQNRTRLSVHRETLVRLTPSQLEPADLKRVGAGLNTDGLGPAPRGVEVVDVPYGEGAITN